MESFDAEHLPIPIAPARVFRLLTAVEFHRLAGVPPAAEWFANLSNPSTRRAVRNGREGLHALRRHPPAARIPDRDARAHHSLA